MQIFVLGAAATFILTIGVAAAAPTPSLLKTLGQHCPPRSATANGAANG